MKSAHVVEVRDLGPLTQVDTRGQDYDPARVERMSGLLRRYPAIAEAERRGLLHFLKKGRHLEVGIVSGREGLEPRLAAFRADHAADFRLGLLPALGFAAAMLAPFAAMAWHYLG